MGLCEYLMANGQGSCTISVGNIGTYTSSVIGLEISDQADNPGGTFNLTQLREQARPLPYVMTDLLMNRSDIMMLYNYVLPGRPIPNLNFLNDATITTTTIATTTVATTTTNTTTTATTTITAAAATTTTITATHTLTPTILLLILLFLLLLLIPVILQPLTHQEEELLLLFLIHCLSPW